MVICFGFGLCFGVPAAVAILIVLDNAQNREAVEVRRPGLEPCSFAAQLN